MLTRFEYALIQACIETTKFALLASGDSQEELITKTAALIRLSERVKEQVKLTDDEGHLHDWVPLEVNSELEGEETRVMCACGDEKCWRGIEVYSTVLHVWEDISDKPNSRSIVIDLSDGVALCRKEKLYVPGPV